MKLTIRAMPAVITTANSGWPIASLVVAAAMAATRPQASRNTA